MNPLSFDAFPNGGQTESQDESLSNGFLQGVDESDRAIVEKYIKDWDGQVTKRFQAIHQQYEPYKNIGLDAETLRNAAWLYEQMDNDPVGMYRQMHRALKELDMWEDPDGTDDGPVGGRQESLPEYEGVPKEFLSEFQQQRAELAELREFTQGFVGHQQEAQEMQMLDGVLQQMHNVAGDFDEEWVLTRLARGVSPQEALNEYSRFVDGIANSRQRKPAPNVFGGSGGVPAGQVDASKMSTPKDRRAFIAAALEASQNG